MLAIADLKRTHRGIWAAGDYAAVARNIDQAPPLDLLSRVDVRPGVDVATRRPVARATADHRAEHHPTARRGGNGRDLVDPERPK